MKDHKAQLIWENTVNIGNFRFLKIPKDLGALLFAIALAGAVMGACSADTATKPATRSFTLIGGAEVGRDGKPYFTPGHLNHAFFGRGGDIDGQPNPTLYVNQGETVAITLLNLDERGQPHVLAIPSLSLKIPTLTKNGELATLTFVAKEPGVFEYNGRTVFGGRERHVHMEGRIVIRPK
jgi:hypothetical protein